MTAKIKYSNKINHSIGLRLFALAVIVLSSIIGIASRKWGAALPTFLANYTGDTMWALACFALFRAVFPRLKLSVIFILALDYSFLTELSQLWHNAFLDGIRNTLIGGLILGFGFMWTDLICYICGCLLGWLLFSIF
jgi:hypothetical protein